MNAINLKIQAKQRLRANIRKKRRSLSLHQQKIASQQLFKTLNSSRLLLCHKHIALYLGGDGEICPRLFIEQLRKRKRKIYLPVIHPLKKQQIVFCRLKQNTKLIKNRFGIEEPEFKLSESLSAKRLSLVLLPLVAFDETGNRMGMGGGFYDKAFAFKMNNKKQGPKLVGLAHDFQKQKELPAEHWDVPLNSVITEKEIYKWEM